MTELSNMVDLERFTGLTTIEIAAAKTDLHMSTCREQIWQCEMCADFLRVIRQVVAAVRPIVEEEHLVDLEAAGRLLPEGATHKANFLVRWYGPTLGDGDGWLDSWGCESLEHARHAATQEPGPPTGAVRGEIQYREAWVGQWAVVEPVEASDG